MNARKLFTIAALMLYLGASVFAQADDKWGEDPAESKKNFSLFIEYAKQKNYADAYNFWTYCYDNCPAASKNIYLYGVRIVKHKISKSKTKEEQQKWIDKLMEVYDQRIKYFGNDKKYPESYILGKKALDLYALRKSDNNAVIQVYEMLEKSIDGLGVNSSTTNTQTFTAILFKRYADYEIEAGEVINKYSKIMNLYDNMEKAFPSEADDFAKLKDALNNNFAISGAASCDKLEAIFGAQVEEQKEDIAFLNKVIDMFDRTQCTDNETYYKASEYVHKIEPSAASAVGVANSYAVRSEFDDAIKFMKQALELEEDDVKKSKYSYTIATMLFSQKKDNIGARKYAREAIKLNSKYGAPYILIGNMYAAAAGKQELGKKDIENLAGYWAAVDKFARAKAVDPESVAEANKFIQIYSNYFPNQEVIFFEPDYEEGKTVTVGGWIQEKTKVRSKK